MLLDWFKFKAKKRTSPAGKASKKKKEKNM